MSDDFIPVFLLGGCVCSAPVLVGYVFFLATLARCLERCQPHSRTLEPGQVWLNLIPGFHLVWLPITIDRLSESLRREFIDRGFDPADPSFGRFLALGGLTLLVFGLVPYLGAFPAFTGLIVWVIYWSRVAAYSRQLDDVPWADRPDDERPPQND